MKLAQRCLVAASFVGCLLPMIHEATAGTITLDFDAVSVPAFGVVDATSYLATFGVTVSNVTSGGQVVIRNDGGLPNFIVPPSSPNTASFFSSVGQIPNTFTLNFPVPLTSLSFTRPQLLTGPSGVTHPQWTATALNSLDVAVAAVGQGLIASFSNVPAQTFTLTGTEIEKLRFDSNNFAFASTVAVVVDDLTLTPVPEPTTLLLFGTTAAGIGLAHWRQRRRKQWP